MTTQGTAWATAVLAAEGFTPLASLKPSEYFTVTGFIVEDANEPRAAKVTVTARSTGQQDKYDHWNDAQQLANRLMDALERQGATFEDIPGREPNCVFETYMPA